MTNKTLLWIGALTFSAVAIAGAKTYDFVLSTSVRAGTIQLAPGEYKLKVDGSNAVFTDTESRKSVTVPIKVENNSRKYNSTALDTTKQGDAERLNAIELGGSKTKLEFGQ
jgi:hypothetical protein